MKKLAYIIGGIIVLLIVVALVAPFFVNLNNYKGLIEAQAKQATGRDLKIDGDISLSLLPVPSVSVSGIKFGNAAGGSAANMAEIDSVKVKVALMPLLSHKAEITNVVLSKPNIVLEKLKDGSGNWVIAPAGSAAAPAAPAPAAGNADNAAAPVAGGAGAGGWDVQVDSASIEDGTLVYRDDATGAEQKVENFNVDLSLDSLKGPFQAKGGMTAMNIPLGFSVNAGRMDPAQPMPVDLSLTVDDAKGSVNFSGQVDMAAMSDPAKPIVTGKLNGKADNVAEVMAAISGGAASSQPPALARAFALRSDVTASQSAAQLQNLALSFGDINANGTVAAKYGAATQVDANLAVSRVDLDKLLSTSGGKAAPASSGSSSSNTAPTAAGSSGGFSLPSGILANVTATVEQVVYQGKAIDGTKLVAQLKDGALNLQQLSAQLPGNTAFALSGMLTPKAGQPSFTGALKASSDNLREVADMFAKGALNSVPADRLRKLALTSRLNASPSQIEIADLAAQLDASKISGGVIVALPDAKRKRMAFGVGLSVDKLNVDGYLPQPKPAAASASTSGGSTTGGSAAKPAAAPSDPLKSLAPLGDLDANIELKGGSLTMNQQQINGLHVLINLANGALNITDLSVKDLLGGSGKISGKIADLKGSPNYNLNFDISAKDAGKLMEMGGLGPQTPGKFGALTLKGTAAGTANDVTYDMTMGMTGIGLDGSAKGKASGLMSGSVPLINSNFDIKAKDTAALAQLFGGPADAAKQLGAVAFSGTAQSGTDDLTYDVTLSIGGIGGSGKLAGKVTGIKSTPQVDTNLNLKAEKPAPLLQLAGLAGPKAQAMGALTVAGTLKGGADNMDLNLDLSGAGATAKLAGNVKAKADPMAFDISLTANHPEFTDLMKLADLPGSGTKGGPLAVNLKASGTTQKASVSQLDAKWGDSSISGTASYDATGAKPQIVANLSGGTINLTPFMAPSTKPNPSKTTSGSGGSGSQGASSSPWSTEPLDLSALSAQDADIDFKAQSLVLPDQKIDDLTAKATLKDGLLTVSTLTGKIYNGDFDLSGTTVNGKGTPAVDAKVAVKNIETGELAGGGIAGSQLKGPISLNLDATGSGLSEADLVRSLNGKGDLNGTVMIIGKIEQTVGSALLGVLGQKVQAVQSVTDSINGVLGNFTGIDNKVSGTFTIKNGVLDTEDTAFSNTKAKGTAKGTVDLGAWVMNMLVDLYNGADASQAFMSVKLTGPVNSPKPAFSGGGAAPSTSGVPGLNIPGVNIPGLGGANPASTGTGSGGTTTTPEPGATGVGGAAGSAIGGAVGGSKGSSIGNAAGGLINNLLGGGKKKDKNQAQPQPQTEPAPSEPAPSDIVPVPGATQEPGATGD
jgi:uncharacterized protein involved in outer membrane biogenesis